MVKKLDEVNKQIKKFIERIVSDDSIPVLNSNTIKTSLGDKARIEFCIANFVSTGRIYKHQKETDDTLIYGSTADYDCQLIIRVFGDDDLSVDLIGALQTSGIVSSYIRNLGIKNESLKVTRIPITSNGIISFFPEIIVDCNIQLKFEMEVDYFDKVKDIKVI